MRNASLVVFFLSLGDLEEHVKECEKAYKRTDKLLFSLFVLKYDIVAPKLCQCTTVETGE